MTSSPAPDLEPRTEAGRRLLASSWSLGPGEPLMADTILAIEVEAARAAVAESGRLREALEGLMTGLRLEGLSRNGPWSVVLGDAIVTARRALLETPPAPSDPDDEEDRTLLREAQARLATTDWSTLPTLDEVVPPAPSDHGALDVERLAAAMEVISFHMMPRHPGAEFAQAIAAEYARLATPSVPPEPASPEPT